MEGLLQEVKLAEIMQLIGLGGKTGDLELLPLYPASQRRTKMPIGHLFFRDGHLHAAHVANRTGEAATENLFLWEAGFFSFRALTPYDLPSPNIQTETQLVILRGVERLDRWETARETVPTLRMVLRRATPPIAMALPDMHTAEARILAACDGTTQLIDIAQQLQLGGLGTREAAAHLLIDGLAVTSPTGIGEKLAQGIIIASMPMLGIAAELFCDDALRATNLAPEYLGRIQTLTTRQVIQVIQALAHDVAAMLGTHRAASLAQTVAAALGVPTPDISLKEAHHV